MVARAQNGRSDALLRQTRRTARAIMRDIRKLPKAERMPRLYEALSSYEPSLPAKVKAVANTLHRRGASLNEAVERALTLSLADASIDRMRRLGEQVAAGRPGASGLGSLGSLAGAEDDLKDLAVSVACSEELQRTAAEKAGESQGTKAYNATLLGFKAASSAVKCPEGTKQDLTKPPPSPPTKPQDGDEMSLAVPIIVGVSVLGLAGVAIWYMRTQ